MLKHTVVEKFEKIEEQSVIICEYLFHTNMS